MKDRKLAETGEETTQLLADLLTTFKSLAICPERFTAARLYELGAQLMLFVASLDHQSDVELIGMANEMLASPDPQTRKMIGDTVRKVMQIEFETRP